MAKQSNTLLASPRFLFRWPRTVASPQPAGKATGIGAPTNVSAANCRARQANTVDRKPRFADVRMAWGAEGLLMNVKGEGNSNRSGAADAARRPARPASWIDTRTTQISPRQPIRHRLYFPALRAGGRRQTRSQSQIKFDQSRPRKRSARSVRVITSGAKITKNGILARRIHPDDSLGGYDPHQHANMASH